MCSSAVSVCGLAYIATAALHLAMKFVAFPGDSAGAHFNLHPASPTGHAIVQIFLYSCVATSADLRGGDNYSNGTRNQSIQGMPPQVGVSPCLEF